MLCKLFFSDIDNNGYLDAHDFECLAVRACVLEGKGDCSSARLAKYQHIMLSLWEEIAQLADFDKVPPDYVGFPIFLLFVRVASIRSTPNHPFATNLQSNEAWSTYVAVCLHSLKTFKK